MFDLPADRPVLRQHLHAGVHVEDRNHIEAQVRCLVNPDEVKDLDVQHRVVNDNGEILWLNALASNQALLISMDFSGVSLRCLLRDQLSLSGNPTTNRINIEGPELVFRTDAVQPIGLAIHEWATNALKYGALSEHFGAVSIM